ncbi:hypothetical protein TNCV_539441 [Trichonephila clavipes]|nr:hypothetical protein TNCV_539441 [Trichonephila clavipes]
MTLYDQVCGFDPTSRWNFMMQKINSIHVRKLCDMLKILRVLLFGVSAFVKIKFLVQTPIFRAQLSPSGVGTGRQNYIDIHQNSGALQDTSTQEIH